MKNAVSKLTFLAIGLAVGLSINDATGQGKKTKEQELIDAREQSRELALERDTCLAKFDRHTILYDGMFSNKKWLIQADVEPIAFGDRDSAAYSHYDPKTQTETVKSKPKHQ